MSEEVKAVPVGEPKVEAPPASIGQPPEHHIQFLKSSESEQPPEVKAFLTQELKSPFNKFCIDCKKQKTTHALIWLGTYVCAGCKNRHMTELPYGSMFQIYPKEIMKEQWDDYQLMSIQLGANKAIFEHFKEYGI